MLADCDMKVGMPGTQRISLSKPDSWAVGRNAIELPINGKTERTVYFETR